MRNALAFAAVLFIAGAGIGAACKPPTPGQTGAVVDGACTVLTAFANSPEEQAICASAEDLAAMLADIRAQRADAGPVGLAARKSGGCQIVATVCATDAELASAIKARRSIK